jgi:hypothetical protein
VNVLDEMAHGDGVKTRVGIVLLFQRPLAHPQTLLSCGCHNFGIEIHSFRQPAMIQHASKGLPTAAANFEKPGSGIRTQVHDTKIQPGIAISLHEPCDFVLPADGVELDEQH